MKKILHYIASICIALVFGVLPQFVEAATITTSVSNEIHAQDIFIIDVSLDTEGQKLNTIEGDIVLNDSTKNFEIRDVSVAGSGFTLWPRKPSVSIDGKTISFIGGIPGGVVGKTSLFKIIVFAKNSSELRISPKNIVGYVDDGKGTPVTVNSKDVVAHVQTPASVPTDEWKQVISTDNVAPEIFDITLYQDPSLYEGKKFLSFQTIDNQSGIAYYEVSEDGALPIRSGDQYVLVDQKGAETITVTGYDMAGNARAGAFTVDNGINWLAVSLWTLVLLVVFFVLRRKDIKNYFKKNAIH